MSHIHLFTDTAFPTTFPRFLTPLLASCSTYIPPWPDSSWYTRYLYGSTVPLVFRLIEGGYWSTVTWLSHLLLLPAVSAVAAYQSISQLKPHQSHRLDVRFWFPTSFDLTIPGWTRYPETSWYRPKKATSPFRHHQYAIRLRVHYKSISLQYGFRFEPLLRYVPIRTLLRKLNTEPLPAPIPDPLKVHVYFDHGLYDRAIKRLESRLYLFQ